MREILKGSTDQSCIIRIIDATDGTPETGVVAATSGLDLKYRRELGATADLTESDLAALTTAHADGGLKHIGAGYYRVDLPDAAVATGANGVLVFGTCTGMVVIGCYLPLVNWNPYDGVRAGLTALPNAAADAAGGLVISDAGGLDVDAQRADVVAILVDTGTTLDGRLPAALVGGRIDANVGAISGDVTAADNLESYTDGTTPQPVNATQISSDATAADTLELFAEALDQATGQLDSGSLAASTLTAAAIAADAITAAKIANGAIDAATFAAGAIDAAAIAANAITDAKVASDVTIASVTGAVGSVTGNVGGNVVGSVASVTAGVTLAASAVQAIWDAATSALTTVGSIGKRIVDFLTGDIYARLGAPAGASLAADLAAIEAQTDDIGASGAGLTALPWNAAWDAEVQSEVQDAIEVNHLDHLLAADYDPASKPGVATALLNELVESDAGVSRYTANALEQAPSGTGASAASIRAEIDANSTQLAAIVADTNELQTDWANGGRLDLILDSAASAGDPWGTAIPGAYGAGTAGKIIGDNLNATVSSRASQVSVDDLPTNAELATALGTADDAVLAAIAALNNLSLANIRTAVGLASANLDTQLADLPTNAELATALGTADDAVLAAIAALNNLSQANIRTAIGLASANLDTQLSDLPTNAELATALAAADDAVLAAIAALNNLSAAGVRTAVGLASANLDTQLGDLPTTAELATALGTADDAVLAAITALNDLSAAQVNAEVDTALADVGLTTTITGRIDAAVSTRATPAQVNTEADTALTDALPAIADAVYDEATSGHTTAGTYGDKFGAHLKAVLKVVVGAGSTTTAVVLNATTGIDAGVPSNVNDFYSGRVLIFTSGDLAGQGTSITSYDGPTKTLTVVALTSAPASAVTAVLV